MKGFIFNTPFYTKTDWHTGRTILSRNGQHKGYGSPNSIEFKRRVSAGQAMSSQFGTEGKVSYKGKIIGQNAFNLASNSQMLQSFGGAQKKEDNRMKAHQATQARLGNAGKGNF